MNGSFLCAAVACTIIAGVGGCSANPGTGGGMAGGGAGGVPHGAAGGNAGTTGGGAGAGGAAEIESIAFDLPSRHYVFDAAAWGLPTPGSIMPTIPCASAADCCASASVVGLDCGTLICDETGACAAQVVPEAPPQQMNLLMDVPALSSLEGKTLANVSISRIKYDAVNTLATSLPPVDLYVAPVGVASANDPRAKKLGTVPSSPPGWVSGGDLRLEPDGEATLNIFARDLATTFIFLARTKVTTAAGAAFPGGTADVTVTGALRATLR